MTFTVFQVGLMTIGLIFLFGGAALAVVASRTAAAARATQAEADIRLAASAELAVEVKRLAEKVERSLAARDAAIENAFLRHNDACMASVQSTMAAHAPTPCHHAEAMPTDENGRQAGDFDAETHLAANDAGARPSFFARLLRRYP